MDGKDESEEYEIAGVSSLRDFHALFGEPQDESQCYAGKKDSPQDNDKGRENDPFSEEPGESKKQNSDMDLSEALFWGHASITRMIHLINRIGFFYISAFSHGMNDRFELLGSVKSRLFTVNVIKCFSCRTLKIFF
jgi:hypothetical protein